MFNVDYSAAKKGLLEDGHIQLAMVAVCCQCGRDFDVVWMQQEIG